MSSRPLPTARLSARAVEVATSSGTELLHRLRFLHDADAVAQGVVVAFTDRTGGVSRPPYHWLNLATRVGDADACVAENRRRAAAAVGFDLDRLALLRQVHGTRLYQVGPGEAGVVAEGDALVTRSAGAVLGILSADCAAVVVAGEAAVAVAHAGWRGLAGGVVDDAVAAAGPVWGAWVGPAIRACCYQVGPEVVEAFTSRRLPVADPTHVDIADAARAALDEAGVDNVAVVDTCTACDSRYYSFRRDGTTGRHAAFVALTAAGAPGGSGH